VIFLLPANGVYLNLVQLRDKELFALTNVGKKPTFCTDNKTHVEVFLLDFNKDIYGEELTVRFLHRIRDEITFKDSQLLIKQIERDLLKAQILNRSQIRTFTGETAHLKDAFCLQRFVYVIEFCMVSNRAACAEMLSSEQINNIT
jgi:hypothetical protein